MANLTPEERRRIYEEEIVRLTAQRDVRRARFSKLLGAIVLVCLAGITIYRMSRPDPVEELKSEAVIANDAIEDAKNVTGAALSLFVESQEDVKADCAAFYEKLARAKARVDALKNERFRAIAGGAISQQANYLEEHTPCGENGRK